jgi:hypothetical protein
LCYVFARGKQSGEKGNMKCGNFTGKANTGLARPEEAIIK